MTSYTFDSVTRIATVIIDSSLPRVSIPIPIDINTTEDIELYLNGFSIPNENIQQLVREENSKSKTVMYVLPESLDASPLLESILNKCNELHPIRFKWTTDIDSVEVTNCLYDYRFNEKFTEVFDRFNFNTKKYILKLQNKSILNEILRASAFTFPGSTFNPDMLTPNIPSLKTPKSLNEITSFFNNRNESEVNKCIIKPVYGFQPNTRVYDRKEYTSVDDLTADIIKQHGSLDVFFQMQKNEANFVWSHGTQNDTPIFIQKSLPVRAEFICYCMRYENKPIVEIAYHSIQFGIEIESRITDLVEAILTLNRLTTTFVTIKIILSSDDRLYFVDLSESMYPIVTGDSIIKDITKLAEMLFLASSE